MLARTITAQYLVLGVFCSGRVAQQNAPISAVPVRESFPWLCSKAKLRVKQRSEPRFGPNSKLQLSGTARLFREMPSPPEG